MYKLRSPRTIALAGLLLLAVLGWTMPLAAQQYLGTLSGNVTDSTGAKVVGAQVTATDVTTNFVTKVVTNGSGDYSIPFLTPDTYTVTIVANGFRSETRTGVTLTAGQNQATDFALKPGTQTQEVIVTADTQLLDTTSANLSTTFSTTEVTDTPNVGRNPFVLVTLAAGIYSSGSGGYFQGKASTFTNPFSGAAVQIDSNGTSGHNRLTLDGIPDDPSERFSGSSYTGFVPSPEAVQEVKVQTASLRRSIRTRKRRRHQHRPQGRIQRLSRLRIRRLPQHLHERQHLRARPQPELHPAAHRRMPVFMDTP